MAQPVVHFEIIGRDPGALRDFFSELFGWEFDTSGEVAEQVSEPHNYGFTPGDDDGIPGGVGGGERYQGRVLVYVGVPDVAAALERAERLGGRREMGPVQAPSGLVVGHFRDPAGNLIGLASVT